MCLATLFLAGATVVMKGVVMLLGILGVLPVEGVALAEIIGDAEDIGLILDSDDIELPMGVEEAIETSMVDIEDIVPSMVLIDGIV